MNPKAGLLQKINDHSAIVGVIGLGYVGLPFAVEKAKVGYTVIGIDRNPERVSMLQQGKNYILDVNDEELHDIVQKGLIKAYMDFSSVPLMDVIVIAVPTPLNINLAPDLQYIEAVTEAITPYLRAGQLVTLESTTYPGTTEEIMLPILKKSGLAVEIDYFLAHSPERVDPGNQRYTTKNTTKVVGGVGKDSLEVAYEFYKQTIDKVVAVSSAKAAELTKVFENTFRAVNIALVNEITMLCDRMELNVWEVLDGSYSKPFGIMPFYPGPGVGGHCIPLDPHYLEWKAKEFNFNTHFINLAGEINRKMPEFVRDKALRILGHAGIASANANILVLGVAYKKDIEDERESPSIEVMKLLSKEKANLSYYDPMIPRFSEHGMEMESVDLSAEILNKADLVLILTDHTDVDYQLVVDHAKRIFDTRNATKGINSGREKITLL